MSAWSWSAFQAAAAAGIPVVPVALRGVRSALRDGTWYLRNAASAGAPTRDVRANAAVEP